MSLVPFGQNISKATSDWLSKCPDIAEFQEKLKEYAWLHQKVKCPECGEKCIRKDQVYDTNGPYSDGEQFICMDCWDSNNIVCKENGLEEDKNPIFAQMPCKNSIKYLNYFVIYSLDKKKIIGKVKNYNAKFHTGKVLLDKFNCEEYGELDPNCEVFSDETLSQKIGPQNKKTRQENDANVCFQATLNDLL